MTKQILSGILLVLIAVTPLFSQERIKIGRTLFGGVRIYIPHEVILEMEKEEEPASAAAALLAAASGSEIVAIIIASELLSWELIKSTDRKGGNKGCIMIYEIGSLMRNPIRVLLESDVVYCMGDMVYKIP